MTTRTIDQYVDWDSRLGELVVRSRKKVNWPAVITWCGIALFLGTFWYNVIRDTPHVVHHAHFVRSKGR